MIKVKKVIILRVLFLVKVFFVTQYSLSQIVYHYIEPDMILEDISRYTLDLDGDGMNDYELIHDTNFGNWPVDWSQISVINHFNGNQLVGTLDGHFHPKALAYNSHLFEGSKMWESFEANLVLNVQAFFDGNLHTYGHWQYINYDAFLGVRFQSQGAQHYGWIRLNVSSDATRIILRDYAYNATPDEPLFAGEGIPLPTIENVTITDVNDNGNGSDIEVAFDYPGR